MPRADNSDRQFLTIKPQDVGTAVDGKPETFPFKKLNDIFSTLQKRIFTLEGRTEPPIIRNHSTMLAPPRDPILPEAGSDKVTLFFNPSTSTFDAAESGASSFSDVINRAGQWDSGDATLVGSAVAWSTEVTSSKPFMWTPGSTTIDIAEPGTYLIQTKLPLSTAVGGTLTAALTTTLGAFSQVATIILGSPVDAPVSHLYVWEKLNDVLDGITVIFASDDPAASISVPATLAILKIK